ncbi:hypothetical protein HY625_00315 [Candidatus Uhrbacteria bacterium]|nr:hypothetical protein [Candidatus Uhrbacteria bacterium]
MFGSKEKKIPPLPVPTDVVFHAMPAQYQGVKHAAIAPLPANVAFQKESARAMPSPPPSPSATSGSPQATAIPVPRGRKKLFIVWGSIAGAVLLLGVLAVIFLAPTQKQKGAVEQVNIPAPSVSVSPPAPTQALPVAETPTPPPAEPVPATPTVKEIVGSLDTDQDGLTDVEEAIYTTDPKKADTDGDGYLDGQEVQNLYNPSGTAPVRLADSTLVKTYTNATFGYTLLYPASWTVRALDEKNPREVLFTAPTEEFIQVIVDDNAEGLSAVQWYTKQFPDVALASLERIFVDTMEGVWTKDKTTAYLTTIDASGGKRLLYGITYNYGERTEVNFGTTLKMMLQSFHVQ